MKAHPFCDACRWSYDDPAKSRSAENGAPQRIVQDFYDVLLGAMKDGKELGFSGRYQRLKPAIETAYNLR